MPVILKRELEGKDLLELRRLTAAGLNNATIGHKLRATPHAVSAAQRRLGIYRRRWAPFPTLPPEEIRRRAEEIQAEWTPEVESRRRVGGPGEWSPIVVPASIKRLIGV